MRKSIGLLIVLVLIVAAGILAYKKMHGGARLSPVERGRYLVQLGGCNDCHTPGYAEKAGKVDEAQWLTGDSLGWQGPWGTTYAINLRLYMQTITQDQWVQMVAKLKSRPPMPYYDLQLMTEDDLRAVYDFIHDKGPAGQPAPPYLPPGVDAATPVVRFPAPPPG